MAKDKNAKKKGNQNANAAAGNRNPMSGEQTPMSGNQSCPTNSSGKKSDR